MESDADCCVVGIVFSLYINKQDQVSKSSSTNIYQIYLPNDKK